MGVETQFVKLENPAPRVPGAGPGVNSITEKSTRATPAFIAWFIVPLVGNPRAEVKSPAKGTVEVYALRSQH